MSPPYEAYFEFAPDALVLVDERGYIVRSNLAAEQIFGYARNELNGKTIELLVPERLREAHVEHRRQFMAAPRSRPMGLSLNLTGRRKDGSEFPVEISLTYAKTEAGAFVICNITDITGRLAREHEDRRREALTVLGTTVAGIAHDLNNPLSVIISRAELLFVSGVELPPEIRADLEVIHRHARRASQIVQDLLALTRQDPRPHETINLNEIVTRALLLIEGQMLREGKKVVVALAEDLPAMMGNPISLEQVLVNLLSNARDAMSPGNTVSVKTYRSHDRENWIELEITDNGCGIPPHALSKLFKFLYTTKPGGTGLGLWLAKRTVAEHGGTIEVKSQVGQGSKFLLSFPSVSAVDDDQA